MTAPGFLIFACFATLAMAADPPSQTSGRYRVILRLPEAGLAAQQENELEFHIEDTDKPDPVTGFAAVVRAAPDAIIDMPSMPGMPKFTELAHPEGIPGDYGIHPTFAHGGEFRLRIVVHPPAGEAFTVEFPLSVSDAAQAAKRKPLPPRFRLEVSSEPRKPKAGQPVELRLVVRDRDNSVISNFETVHEALLHLVMVRRDLSQFAHEHPVWDPQGAFRLSYTFPSAGEYRLFADLAPRGAGSQILTAPLNVSGDAGRAFDLRKAGVESLRASGDSLVKLLSTEVLPVRKAVTLEFDVRDAATNQPPSDLQPYLGVAGHLMLVHEDAATFVHCHPSEEGSALRFLARFPKPGLYRGWVQFQRAGTVRTADFVFRAGDAP